MMMMTMAEWPNESLDLSNLRQREALVCVGAALEWSTTWNGRRVAKGIAGRFAALEMAPLVVGCAGGGGWWWWCP